MRLVFDVGGTKIAYGVYEDGEVEVLGKVPTPKDVPIWKVLVEISKPLNPSEISIASMGPLKLSEGKIINNPHLPEREQELAKPLQNALGKRVYLVNDACAGAWAEAKARGAENLLYVAFGTGVGVGAVVDGVLLLGKDGNAHEFGHVTMTLGQGLRCGCGGADHVEASLGGSNLPSLAKRLGRAVESAKEYFKLLEEDDELFEDFSTRLKSFLASAANAYDPEVIVLGGGVFFKNEKAFWRALEGFEDFEGLVVEPPVIERASYGELSPLVGAGLLVDDKPSNWIKRLKYMV